MELWSEIESRSSIFFFIKKNKKIQTIRTTTYSPVTRARGATEESKVNVKEEDEQPKPRTNRGRRKGPTSGMTNAEAERYRRERMKHRLDILQKLVPVDKVFNLCILLLFYAMFLIVTQFGSFFFSWTSAFEFISSCYLKKKRLRNIRGWN